MINPKSVICGYNPGLTCLTDILHESAALCLQTYQNYAILLWQYMKLVLYGLMVSREGYCVLRFCCWFHQLWLANLYEHKHLSHLLPIVRSQYTILETVRVWYMHWYIVNHTFVFTPISSLGMSKIYCWSTDGRSTSISKHHAKANCSLPRSDTRFWWELQRRNHTAGRSLIYIRETMMPNLEYSTIGSIVL